VVEEVKAYIAETIFTPSLAEWNRITNVCCMCLRFGIRLLESRQWKKGLIGAMRIFSSLAKPDKPEAIQFWHTICIVVSLQPTSTRFLAAADLTRVVRSQGVEPCGGMA
jgi:hypothetical protein